MENNVNISVSKETIKVVNANKEGKKVMVLKAYFNLPDTDSSGKPTKRLMDSAMQRYAVEAHAPVNGVMTAFTGNIPCEQLPCMLELAKEALHDKLIGQEKKQFKLLPTSGTWKPKASVKDAEGNTLVYDISVTYNGGMTFPVVIDISNAYTKVTRTPDGRYNIPMSGAKGKITTKLCISAEEWYNAVTHAYEKWRDYNIALTTRGQFDSEFGLK